MTSETSAVSGGEDLDYEDERNPDGLPHSSDPSGPCPRCGRVSNFTAGDTIRISTVSPVFARPSQVDNAYQVAVVLTCHGCNQGTVVIEDVVSGFVRQTVPVHWWPMPGTAVSMTDVPDELAAAYLEGLKCLSVEAPHAAVAMFRNALAHIVQNKGSDEAKKKGTLNLAIQQMVADKTLFDSFDEWATQIRTVGNAGAHQESWEQVPIEDAQDLQKITLALIENLYIRPAEIARMRKPSKRAK